MSSQSQDEPLSEQIMEAITWRIRSGFFGPDRILESAATFLSDEDETISFDVALRKVRPVVAAEWAAELERQQKWPEGPTISDRISQAFESLERNHKILGRMSHSCCQRCGISELASDRDEDTKGFVFFTDQEMEHVAGGSGRIHLSFGSFTKSKGKNTKVGEVIVRSLRRKGVSVDWNGDTGRKIIVESGEWRRRLPEDVDIEDILDEDYEPSEKSGGTDEGLEYDSEYNGASPAEVDVESDADDSDGDFVPEPVVEPESDGPAVRESGNDGSNDDGSEVEVIDNYEEEEDYGSEGAIIVHDATDSEDIEMDDEPGWGYENRVDVALESGDESGDDVKSETHSGLKTKVATRAP